MRTVDIAICSVLMLLAGCRTASPPPDSGQRSAANRWLVNEYSDMAVRNAIITQHTLYSYHFVSAADALNGLGRHDLAVLTAHFREHAGTLNIRRDGEPDDLYNRRVAAVSRALDAAGLAKDRVQLSDGLPAGPGLPAQNVLTILTKTADPGSARPYPARPMNAK